MVNLLTKFTRVSYIQRTTEMNHSIVDGQKRELEIWAIKYRQFTMKILNFESSASTTTKEVVYNHSDDQNPIPASNDHVVHPSTNEWSQLPSDFNFLPFHEEWTSQNVIPYATESPNFAPSGTNYLSSMMNSASQFWFQ